MRVEERRRVESGGEDEEDEVEGRGGEEEEQRSRVDEESGGDEEESGGEEERRSLAMALLLDMHVDSQVALDRYDCDCRLQMVFEINPEPQNRQCSVHATKSLKAF